MNEDDNDNDDDEDDENDEEDDEWWYWWWRRWWMMILMIMMMTKMMKTPFPKCNSRCHVHICDKTPFQILSQFAIKIHFRFYRNSKMLAKRWTVPQLNELSQSDLRYISISDFIKSEFQKNQKIQKIQKIEKNQKSDFVIFLNDF